MQADQAREVHDRSAKSFGVLPHSVGGAMLKRRYAVVRLPTTGSAAAVYRRFGGPSANKHAFFANSLF